MAVAYSTPHNNLEGQVKQGNIICATRNPGDLRKKSVQEKTKISRLYTLPEEPCHKLDKKGNYHYTDPLNETPPEYLGRLSEMPSLECGTVYEEINKTITKEKQERNVGKLTGKKQVLQNVTSGTKSFLPLKSKNYLPLQYDTQ